MKEIGEKLLEAREQKGISLEQISELTKIRSVYLQALETGEVDNLPDKVYVKGFLRSYAKIVDLDPREILEIYQRYIDKVPADEAPKKESAIIYKRPRSVGKIILTILIIGVVGGVGFFAQNILSTIKDETIPQLVEADTESPLNQPGSLMTNDQLPPSTNLEDEITPDKTVEQLATEATDQNNSLGTALEETTFQRGVETNSDEMELKPQSSDRDDNPEKSSLNYPATPEENRVEKPEIFSEVEKTTEKTTLLPEENHESQTDDDREKTSLEEKLSDNREKRLVQLQIIANENAWVRVSIDDQVHFQGIIEQETTELFEGKKIIVRSTNAAAIQINYGGVLLGPFGEQGEFMEKVFGE